MPTNNKETKLFDLILVYSFGRVHAYYLNIIKYLSGRYKIGLLLSDDKDFYSNPEVKVYAKAKKTEKLYRKLCVQFGAGKIYINEKCHCKLLITHPHSLLLDKEEFKNNITWDRLIGIFPLLGSSAGFDKLKALNPAKYFVVGKPFLMLRAETDGFSDKLKDLDITEAGFPYKKYPVFDNLNLDIDYLIAIAAPVHFRDGRNREKYEYFKTLLETAGKIPAGDKVYIKYHNNMDRHRFFNITVSKCPRILKLTLFIIESAIKALPFAKKKLYNYAAFCINSLLESGYPNLENLTEFHNLPLELFLPHVKKGVLSSYSGIVLHCLYNRIPVYNCDPQKESVAFTPYNAPYRIPCSNGELCFDEANYNKISDEFRNADMIKLIEDELN